MDTTSIHKVDMHKPKIVSLHHQVGELVRDSEELIMFINVMLSEGFEGHQGYQVQ